MSAGNSDTSGSQTGPRPDSAGRQGPPTPVRAMMGRPEVKSPEEAAVEEAPSRQLEIEGETWVAHAIGHTRSGTAPDTGAPLLLVGFRRPDGSEAGDESEESGAFEREVLAVAGRLADLSDTDLEQLLERSRPFRPVPAPEEREDRRTSPVRKDLGRKRGR